MENQDAVNVINPATGEIGSLPAAQAQKAIAQGIYKPASDQDLQQYQDQQEHGGVLGGIGAAIEGGLSSATFGASSAVEKGLSKIGVPGLSSEEQMGRERAHPLLHGAGSIAGLAGLNFVPGLGEAADVAEAKRAATLAKDALEAGKMSEGVAAPIVEAGQNAKKMINPLNAQSVMSGLGERAAQGLGLTGDGLLPQMGAGAVKGAVETALFQSGDEVSKLINDPDESLGMALTNVGLSGLLGAGFGAPLGAVHPLWKAANFGKVGQEIENAKGRLKEYLENPDSTQAVHDELQKYFTQVKEMADDVYGAKGLKAQDIQKTVPELNDKIVEQAGNLSGSLYNKIEEMRAAPKRYPERLVADLEDEFSKYQEALQKPNATSHEIFKATEELKQWVQGNSKFEKRIMPFQEEAKFVQSMKGLGSEIRSNLEDSGVWGKAAERQQAINKAFVGFKPALEDFESKFTSWLGNDRVIDPGKINTYMNQLGKPNAELKQEMLKNFLGASEKYQKVIEDTHANLGIAPAFEPSSLTAVKKTLNELTPGAKIMDSFLKKGLGKLAGGATGAAVGSLLGHGWIGALIGEHALGGFYDSILPTLIKPLLEKEASPEGFKAAVDFSSQVMKGERLTTRAVKNLFQAGKEVLPTGFLPTEKGLEKLDNKAKEFQENPESMLAIGGSLGHYRPDHATAATQTASTVVGALNSMRPDVSPKLPLDPERKLSGVEKSEYQMALTVAEQPLSILAGIKNGTITTKEVVLMKTFYPALYQRTAGKIISELTEHKSRDGNIPYHTKMGLSLFLGQPLDSTMTPQFIQATQMPAKPLPSEQSSTPPQNAKHSMAALNKLPGMYQTPGQSRESYRGK